MSTPFKMKGMSFGNSPAKQKDFIKYNAAGQRVNMMGVPHGTPKSKLTAIGSLKDKYKHLYKHVKVTAKKVGKKVIKGVGGKALGVAGMLGATSATATQPGTGKHGGKKQTTYNPKTGKYE